MKMATRGTKGTGEGRGDFCESSEPYVANLLDRRFSSATLKAVAQALALQWHAGKIYARLRRRPKSPAALCKVIRECERQAEPVAAIAWKSWTWDAEQLTSKAAP